MSKSDLPPGSDEQWQALLHQLQRHPKAEPQPFFYARVHARLLAQNDASNTLLPRWLRRPAYAAALCALVLTMSGDGAEAVATSAGNHTSTSAQQLAR